MFKHKSVGLRIWVLGGAAAAGFVSLPFPAMGQVNNALYNPKLAKPKPAAARPSEPPKLLAVPDTYVSPVNAVQPISQAQATDGGKSEVQKQLDLLYEKDGREQPNLNMNFNLQPINPAMTNPATTPAQGARPGQAPSTQKPATPAQANRQFQPANASRPQATPYPNQPPRNYSAAVDAQNNFQPPMQPQAQPQTNKKSVASFFKKLTTAPTKSPAPLNPVPPDYANKVPEIPPASMATLAQPQPQRNSGYNMVPQSLPNNRTTAATRPAGSPQTVSIQQIPKSIPQTGGVTIAAVPTIGTTQFPQPAIQLPALAQEPQPLTISPEAAVLPSLNIEPPQTVIASTSTPQETTLEQPIADSASDFPNPFPDQKESVADATGKPSNEILQHPLAETKPAKAATAKIAASESLIHDENPYAVRTKDFAEPSLDEREETIAKIAPAISAGQLELPGTSPSTRTMAAPQALTSPELTPPALTPPPIGEPISAIERKAIQDAKSGTNGLTTDDGKFESSDDTHDAQSEKMQRIRERFGMKGLKGFCPVTLRDERELMDAKPEFQSTYRGQRFHFATEEARLKFEAEPSLYTPAAYGADVVALCCEKEIIEGTLDFAAWYKGRLYLFGTQTNYDAFVKSPAKYATPAGIE